MAPCEHVSLLRAVRGDEVRILDHHRFEHLVAQLNHPSHQFPCFQFFVGKKTKRLALQQLFPHNNLQRNKRQGESVANIALDAAAAYSEYPIIFADSEAWSMGTSQSADSVCHRTVCHFTHWSNDLMPYVDEILHARLFFLFADVICLFADDFKDFSVIAKLLRVWSSFASVTGRSSLTLPSVVIVSTDTSIVIPNSWGLELMELPLFQDDAASLRAAFSRIRLIRLQGENLSPSARFRRLKEFLARQSDEMRVLRIQEGMLFSAKHKSRLFNLALQHTLTTVTRPFDFISASREYCKPPHDHQLHLARFFRLGIQYRAPFDELASYVASSFLMNAYPPGMHSMSHSSLMRKG